jgi:cell division protein FtsQ
VKRPQQRGRKPETKTAKVIPISRNLPSKPPKKPTSAKSAGRFPKLDRGTLKQLRSQARRFQGESRQSRIIVITLLSSFTALLLLVVATLVTPMLAVEKIRITGLQKVAEKSVLSAVRSNVGKPLALVSQEEIADQLSKFKLIESISIVSELPHTLHIAISERQPIAIVDVAGASVLFDAAAVNLGSAKYTDKYPRILINDDPKSSKAFGLAIDVLLALPSSLLTRVAVIDAKTKDDVRLQLRGYSAQLIIWGDASQGTLKSKVLAALIKNQKQTDRVTYDVSSPSAPVVRYR